MGYRATRDRFASSGPPFTSPVQLKDYAFYVSAKERIVDCSRFDLTPQEAKKIASFLGYGSPEAPVWFVGYEEGLGNMSDDEAMKNLKVRGGFDSVMDLREAHLQLLEEGRHIDIEINPPSTLVWRFMAKIALARNGCADWQKSNTAKDYVKGKLGRRKLGHGGDDTFLTELSPIPTGRNSDTRWMTEILKCYPQIKGVIETRKAELRERAKKSPPRLVICYGEAKRAQFEEFFQIEWKSVFPTVHSAIDSGYLLLPFFGRGYMSKSLIARLLDLGLLNRC